MKCEVSFSRPLGELHFGQVTLGEDPVVPFKKLTVTGRALGMFGSPSESANRDETLRAFVGDFAFDTDAKNRRSTNMVLRDCPEKMLCIWATPGGNSAHVLMWDECEHVDRREEVRRFWERQHSK